MPGDSFYMSGTWKALRAKVLKRDGYRCTACSADVRGKGQARVDHIVPRRKEPKLALVMSNLRTLCITCDAARHAEKAAGKGEAWRTPVDEQGFPESWASDTLSASLAPAPKTQKGGAA